MQVARSSPTAGARGALVLDGQQPVAGMGGAGCRSWPASWGDHGRGLRCPDWFAAAVAGVGANMG